QLKVAAALLMFSNLLFSQTELAGFCFDKSGNVYCGGNFKNVIDLGSGNIINGLDSFNIYVAKFNSKGACAWVSRFGGDHSQTVSGLACDATGNTYATGSF